MDGFYPYIMGDYMETKRQKQTAEVIRRHLGHVLMMEGSYIYGGALVTITKVKVTPDMSECKVYISIYNATDKEKVLENIRKNTHSLKRNLSGRIRKHVRRVPKIQFYTDDTLDEVNKMDNLFKQLRESNQMGEEE